MTNLRLDPLGRTCEDCAEELGESIPLDNGGTCHGCGANYGKAFTSMQDAFAYCREKNAPVRVFVDGKHWKLYPSGRADEIS